MMVLLAFASDVQARPSLLSPQREGQRGRCGTRGAGAHRSQGLHRHGRCAGTAIARPPRRSSPRAATTASTLERNAQGAALLGCERGVREAEAEDTRKARTETEAHGRTETRIGTVVAAKGASPESHDFAGLKAFGRIEATRVIDGKTETRSTRASSRSRALMKPDELLLHRAREHWQEFENGAPPGSSMSAMRRGQRTQPKRTTGQPTSPSLRRCALDA